MESLLGEAVAALRRAHARRWSAGPVNWPTRRATKHLAGRPAGRLAHEEGKDRRVVV